MLINYNVCFCTGLRLGEILALTWDDINFDDKTVSVNKSIRQETIFNNKGEGVSILPSYNHLRQKQV